jgi:lactoylglutathione lyase
MVRVRNLAESLAFYVTHLGLVEVRRMESEKGRFTLVYLCAPEDVEEARAAIAAGRRETRSLELTWNWDDEVYTGGRNFGHVAYEVDDIHATCAKLMAAGIAILRPPRDGQMAFVRSPDGVSIEFLQKGGALTPTEPWLSMPNSGSW